jgi:hypothetical protein
MDQKRRLASHAGGMEKTESVGGSQEAFAQRRREASFPEGSCSDFPATLPAVLLHLWALSRRGKLRFSQHASCRVIVRALLVILSEAKNPSGSGQIPREILRLKTPQNDNK